MDGENNGQGMVQGPDLHCCLTRHSTAMATAHAWLPRNRARDTYQEARGKLGLGGRAGEQEDGAPLLQKEHKTLQLPAARNFGFCFQASTSGKLPRGGDMDCSLR